MLLIVDRRTDLDDESGEVLHGRARRAIGVPCDGDFPRRDEAFEVDDVRPRIVWVDGQERHERDAEPGGDELMDDAAVIRSEDDVQVHAGGAERLYVAVDCPR